MLKKWDLDGGMVLGTGHVFPLYLDSDVLNTKLLGRKLTKG